MRWTADLGPQLLADSGLTLQNSSTLVNLSSPANFLTGDSVDGTLVTHGRPVTHTIPG